VLSVNIGCEMLRVVPGRVSTEVDAHLSYDTGATYDKALRLMDLYAAKGAWSGGWGGGGESAVVVTGG